MFLFSCCTQIDTNNEYEFRAKSIKQKQYSIISALDHQNQPVDSQTQVLKVKKSQYQELVKKYKNSA